MTYAELSKRLRVLAEVFPSLRNGPDFKELEELASSGRGELPQMHGQALERFDESVKRLVPDPMPPLFMAGCQEFWDWRKLVEDRLDALHGRGPLDI